MTNINYLYNKKPYEGLFNIDRFVDKKLSYRVIERGTLLPHKRKFNGRKGKSWVGFGGLVDNQGKRVKVSPSGQIYKPTVEIKKSNSTVIYLGLFAPTWGHNLTVNLSRLWFLIDDSFKKEFGNCPIVYLPWKSEKFIENQKNFSRLLEILDIDVEKLQPITEPTQFENIILPDASFFRKGGVEFFTSEYRETVDRIRNFALKNRTPTSSEKIYLFHGRRQMGEKRLAEYFQSKGYSIVLPEELTVDEQLNLMINCKSFASTLGSCTHNSVFLRDGTETIFIPRSADFFTGYQQAIDQVRNLNANYIDSTISLFGVRKSIFYIISRQLKDFFGDNFDGYTKTDCQKFLKYMLITMKKRTAFSDKSKDYYRPVFDDLLSALKNYNMSEEDKERLQLLESQFL